MKKIILILMALTGVALAQTPPPTDFVFQHYEAFGGSMVNNLVGFITESFMVLTGGVTYSKLDLIGLSIFLAILIGLYSFVKSLDFRDISSVFYDERQPWWNLITKSFLIFILFDFMLKPIPMIQMTPIVGYKSSSSGVGVNKGDREILGWMVNDLKSTISDVNQASPVAPGSVGNNRIIVVPQILGVIGYIEKSYYGFPDIKASDYVYEDTSTYAGALSSGAPTKRKQMFWKSGAQNTIYSCVSSSKKAEFLKDNENSLTARIEQEDIIKNCASNITLGSSIFVSLFGTDISSTIVSDFFEPIDQMYYYMIGSQYNEVLLAKLNLNYKKELTVKSNELLIDEIDIAKNSKELKEHYSTLITLENSNIREIANKMFKDLSDLETATATMTYPKEIAILLTDILTQQSLPKVWRKNLPSIDVNEEETAIKNIDFNQAGLTNEVKKRVLEEEKNWIKQNLKASEALTTKQVEPKVNDYLRKLYELAKTKLSDDSFQDEYDNLGSNYRFTGPLNSSLSVGTVDNFYDTSVPGISKIKQLTEERVNWELMVTNRRVLLTIVQRQADIVDELVAQYEETKTRCMGANSTPSSTKACISGILNANITRIEKEDSSGNRIAMYSLRNVFAGMYPSTIYYESSRAIKDPKDKTGSALFLSHQGVVNNITSSSSGGTYSVLDSSLTALPPLLLSSIEDDELFKYYQSSDTEYIRNCEFMTRLQGSDLDCSMINHKIEQSSISQHTTSEEATEEYFTELEKKKGITVGSVYNDFKSIFNSTSTMAINVSNQGASTLSGPKDFLVHELVNTYSSAPSLNQQVNIDINQHRTLIADLLLSQGSSNYKKLFFDLVRGVENYVAANGSGKLEFNEKVKDGIKKGYPNINVDNSYIVVLEAVIEAAAQANASRVESEAKTAVATSVQTSVTTASPLVSKIKQLQIASTSVEKQKTTAGCATNPQTNTCVSLSNTLSKFNAQIEEAKKVLINKSKSTTGVTPAPAPAVIKRTTIELNDNLTEDNMLYRYIVKPVLALQWGILTEVLDTVREYQNVAMVKVTYFTHSSNGLYDIDRIIGPGVIPTISKATLPPELATPSIKNNSFLPPYTIKEAIEEIKTVLTDEETLSKVVGGGVVATGATWLASKTDSGTFVLKIMISIIYFLFAAIIVLPLLLLFRIIKVVLLGVIIGIMGIIRITMLLPLSLVIWVMSYNVGSSKTLSSLESLFKYIDKPMEQLKVSSKQLLVWVFATFILGVMMYISQNIFGQYLMDQSILVLLDKMTAGAIEGPTMLSVLFTNGFAILAIFFIVVYGYSLILSYITSTIKETPLMKKVGDMLEQQEKASSIGRMAQGSVSKVTQKIKGV